VQELRVKREGKACTVYVDPVTDQPMSCGGYDDEAPLGFPKLMMQHDVEAMWGRARKIVYVDRAPRQQATVVSDAANEVVEKLIKQGDLEAAALRKKNPISSDLPNRRLERIEQLKGTRDGSIEEMPSDVPTETLPTHPSAPRTGTPLMPTPALRFDPVIRELEVMFAKRQVASGKTWKLLDQEIQAVCNFICRVLPGSEETLLQLSQRFADEQRKQF